MAKKKLFLLFFIVMAAAQLYVPAQMIASRELIRSSGTLFKFKVAPVDPNDPFRGKYIRLDYSADRYYDTLSLLYDENSESYRSRMAFALLDTDDDGYAKLHSIRLEAPESGHYVPVEIYHGNTRTSEGRSANVVVNYPFDKFYMDEMKAPKAETAQRELRNDSSTVTYAKVYVHQGSYLLDDVMINDTSIADYVSKLSPEE